MLGMVHLGMKCCTSQGECPHRGGLLGQRGRMHNALVFWGLAPLPLQYDIHSSVLLCKLDILSCGKCWIFYAAFRTPHSTIVRWGTEEGDIMDVHGKVCIITGAGSGIGSAAALALAAQGAKLALV